MVEGPSSLAAAGDGAAGARSLGKKKLVDLLPSKLETALSASVGDVAVADSGDVVAGLSEADFIAGPGLFPVKRPRLG